MFLRTDNMSLKIFFLIAACFTYSITANAIDDRIAQRVASSVYYTVYTIDNHREGYRLNVDDIANSPLVSGRKTAIIVHGIQGHQNGISTFFNVLKDAFLTHDPELNIITLDWSVYAALPQVAAIGYMSVIAQNLYNVIVKLGEDLGDSGSGSLEEGFGFYYGRFDEWGSNARNSNEFISMNDIHLVGFDAGAHLAGMTGRLLKEKVARITALDPARNGWDANSQRLRSTDAKYVEVIHTDTGTGAAAMGIIEAIGGADYYPNGGVTQTGCTNNLCHHDRAWELFAASLSHDALVGNRCLTMAQVTSNTCSLGTSAAMGNNDLSKFSWDLNRVNTGRIYPYYV